VRGSSKNWRRLLRRLDFGPPSGKASVPPRGRRLPRAPARILTEDRVTFCLDLLPLLLHRFKFLDNAGSCVVMLSRRDASSARASASTATDIRCKCVRSMPEPLQDSSVRAGSSALRAKRGRSPVLLVQLEPFAFCVSRFCSNHGFSLVCVGLCSYASFSPRAFAAKLQKHF